MTTGELGPQIELRRELILTGDLDQLNSLLEVEAGISTDDAFRRPRRVSLTLFGPIARGASTCWLVHNGFQLVLSSYHDGAGLITITNGLRRLSVSPDMTLQQIYDRAVAERLDICRALHLGLLSATPLPHGRLRLLFALAGFENPSLFWLWVDGLTAELHRLGFLVAPPGVPPPSDEPWLRIPDLSWHRQALELWWSGLAVAEIAVRLGYSEKTVRNILSILRAAYGTDVVPTAAELSRLNAT